MTAHPAFPPRRSPRVAVFVDGDNVAAGSAGAISHLAAGLGSVDLARVFAGDPETRKWHDIPGFEVIRARVGAKITTDTMLCLDALDVACNGSVDTFLIATADADFVPLVQRLRARGHAVIGYSDNQANRHLRAACSAFHTPPRDIVEASVHVIGDGEMTLQTFSKILKERFAYTRDDMDHSSWIKFFTAHDARFHLSGTGNDSRIRVRSERA